eukprot:CAMPEP_0197175470 /NCGR_PEP_ID=MMETSP1423-20130617/1686_1 /TAXON_ID=476441 /ORGANISM="Pseudo-nitzschia heimii, Strain UNC1101" /LENGTH=74 /DNA_ID=CAMNT_0042624643 /DNA_START=194 /DNA_END=415 /DNA_ORIENTATION=-
MNGTVDVANDADKEKGGRLPVTTTEVGFLYWYVLAGPLFAGAILAAPSSRQVASSRRQNRTNESRRQIALGEIA